MRTARSTPCWLNRDARPIVGPSIRSINSLGPDPANTCELHVCSGRTSRNRSWLIAVAKKRITDFGRPFRNSEKFPPPDGSYAERMRGTRPVSKYLTTFYLSHRHARTTVIVPESAREIDGVRSRARMSPVRLPRSGLIDPLPSAAEQARSTAENATTELPPKLSFAVCAARGRPTRPVGYISHLARYAA